MGNFFKDNVRVFNRQMIKKYQDVYKRQMYKDAFVDFYVLCLIKVYN